MRGCLSGCLSGLRGLGGGGKVPVAASAPLFGGARGAGVPSKARQRGDRVEIYSHSLQAWCTAIVENARDGVLTVVFPSSEGKPGDVARKDISVDHFDLRDSAADWTTEERARYAELWQAFLTSKVPVHEFLDRSGLPRHALKAIWQVANPEMRPALEEMQFWLCCRLVGHCQLLQADNGQLLEDGGPKLTELLQRGCANGPAPMLPEFSASSGGRPSAGATYETAYESGRAWSGEEEAAYEGWLSASGAPDAQRASAFLASSGLPRHALRAIWEVANNEFQNTTGLFHKDNFFMCCRLIGHCQAFPKDQHHAKFLEDGGRPLQDILQEQCAGKPPQQLPRFQATPSAHAAPQARAPAAWSNEELAYYAQLAKESGSPDPQRITQFLQRAGLPRHTLKGIWDVATASTGAMGTSEFYMSCRLIGHCQAIQLEPRNAQVLEAGGTALAPYLRAGQLKPPAHLAVFQGAGASAAPGGAAPGTAAPEAASAAAQPAQDPSCPGVAADLGPAEPGLGPADWSAGEKAAYTRLFSEYGALDPQLALQFLERAGLPRHTFKAVWELANPTMKPTLGTDEFWMCCRLVGHCQALQGHSRNAVILEEGGPTLVAMLKERCMGRLPPQLPDFRRRAMQRPS